MVSGVLKSKFDAEALESATLSKKLTDTKYSLAQSVSANAQLTRTQGEYVLLFSLFSAHISYIQ